MSTVFDPTFGQRPEVQPVHVEDQPVGVRQTALRGLVAPAAGNGASTGVATDYTFGWASGQVVNHVLLQNNTAASLNYEIDAPASPGTMTLATGQIVFLDIQMAALHLYTAASQSVNGATSGGIVVRGWF